MHARTSPGIFEAGRSETARAALNYLRLPWSESLLPKNNIPICMFHRSFQFKHQHVLVNLKLLRGINTARHVIMILN